MTLWSSHHSISDDATEPSPLWCSGWGKMKRRFMSQDISIAINLCLEFWCPGMLKRRSGQDCCEDVFQIAFPSDRQCAALVPLPQSDNCLWDGMRNVLTDVEDSSSGFLGRFSHRNIVEMKIRAATSSPTAAALFNFHFCSNWFWLIADAMIRETSCKWCYADGNGCPSRSIYKLINWSTIIRIGPSLTSDCAALSPR